MKVRLHNLSSLLRIRVFGIMRYAKSECVEWGSECPRVQAHLALCDGHLLLSLGHYVASSKGRLPVSHQSCTDDITKAGIGAHATDIG